MLSRNPWALTAGLLVTAAAVLTASHWPVFPYFLDSYYHLAVIEGFKQAGGPVLHAFWEAAPEGRPHLYPPLFHLLFLPGRLAGVPAIELARFWTWVSFPLLLGSAWLTLSRVTTFRYACLAMIALAAPYGFFLGTVNYLPATLVLVLSLWILLALHRGRWLAAGLFLGAAFWLHAGLPWLVALTLVLFGLFEPEYRKNCWKALAVGLAAASPWLLHQLTHLSGVQLQPRGEDRMLEFAVPWLALAAIGFPVAWRRGGMFRFVALLAIGFLPMALAGYKFRFLSTQGLFPLLLLAAAALDRLIERIKWSWAGAAALAALALLSPSVAFSDGRASIAWGDTAMGGLSGLTPIYPRGTGNPIYNRKFMGELTEVVEKRTGPDDLVYCNIPYLAGMMTAFTGRAATNQMLREMPDRPLEQQLKPARLVIWLKDLSGKPMPQMRQAAERFGLQPAGETGISFYYLNPAARGGRRPAPAVLPWWAASLLILSVAAAALWDLRRRPARPS